MVGKIIKGIAGFYYVNISGVGTFECNAKGAFRAKGEKPLVGDDVDMEIVDRDKLIGNVSRILPRHSELIRPSCANVDRAIVIFAVRTPDPNLNLLDRFLIYMERENIPCAICFNKSDLSDKGEEQMYRDIYKGSGHPFFFVSTKTGEGMDAFRAELKGKTTVIAGPSGVGKSSIINLLSGQDTMETGNISKKTERGRHTTRHVELLNIDQDTYILDTPGFTSLEIFKARDEIKYSYREFEPYEGQCRFLDCMHVSEPDCAVKEAVNSGAINRIRYESYVKLFHEAKISNTKGYL